jgi:hypothetical protein
MKRDAPAVSTADTLGSIGSSSEVSLVRCDRSRLPGPRFELRAAAAGCVDGCTRAANHDPRNTASSPMSRRPSDPSHRNGASVSVSIHVQYYQHPDDARPPLPRRPLAPGIDPSEAWRFQDDAEPVVIAPPKVPAVELLDPVNASPPESEPSPWSGPVDPRATKSRRCRSTRLAKCADSVDLAGRRTDWPPKTARRYRSTSAGPGYGYPDTEQLRYPNAYLSEYPNSRRSG